MLRSKHGYPILDLKNNFIFSIGLKSFFLLLVKCPQGFHLIKIVYNIMEMSFYQHNVTFE